LASIILKTQDWPIVITTINGNLEEAQLLTYFDEFMTRVLQRGELFASIVDARNIDDAPSARVRRIVADWENQHGAMGEKVNVGIAIVTTSALVRGAMTAINWISPPRVPTTYEARLNDAITWANARLRERGVMPNREIRAV
jgi:hypothetical protein